MARHKSSDTIAFRVTRDLARRIDACSEARKLSRGVYCREAISEATNRELSHQTEEDLAALRERCEQIELALDTLGELVCRATTLLLVKAGEMEIKDAIAIVKKQLRRKNP